MTIIEKKTKIVATLGPVTGSVEVLTKLINAGLNVARLNFSHADFAEHQGRLDNVKKAMKKTGKTVAILQDLGGPKIRIGNFYQERVMLTPGETFTLTTDDVVGDEHNASVNYPNLHKELKVGGFIMLDDGKKKLQVTGIEGNKVICKIILGGETKGRRGINLPGAYLSISSITEKDRKDLEFGIKNKVDFVAFSFVRRGEDVKELRALLDKAGSKAKIVSKIETQEAVENLEEIIALSDCCMVARGDLATEIGAENVPIIQKLIIKKCNLAAKPVITATQMLESMIKLPIPTRAEVSDVANAILDGTDAVMLSEETTLGDYPVESVTMLATIAKRVEQDYNYKRMYLRIVNHDGVKDSLSQAVVNAANDAKAKVIVSLTEHGRTSRMFSRFKPKMPIIAFTPNEVTAQQGALSWGVYSIILKRSKDFESVLKTVKQTLLKQGLVSKGDTFVVSGGMPFGKAIDTNMLVVEKA